MNHKYLILIILWACCILNTVELHAQYYNFDNVSIGGGGYVTGLMFHPTEENLLYARTDVGGAYRWDENQNQWKQLLLSVPEYAAVDGFALTESNPNILYMACGNSASKNPKAFDIIKSTDKGETWIKLGFNNIAGIERAFEGNQRDVRYIGERIAVDPANENIVFVGTKEDGLWRSINGGSSWNKVNSIPNSTISTVITHSKNNDGSNVNAGIVGVRNILFDKTSISGGKTNVIYVGNYEDGLYKSINAGASFSKIAGSPETIRRMDLTPNGNTLWVTTGYPIGGAWGDGGKVYKFAGGTWQDQNLTPVGAEEPMGALDVHPTDPNKIYLTSGKNSAEQKIYRTEDGGANWYEIHWKKNNREHEGNIWWHDWLFATGPSAIAFNPFQAAEVWFASGEGVWKTDEAWNSAPLWKAEVDKIEELVGFVVKAPLSGAKVMFGCADADGFRITDVLNTPQNRVNGPDFSETTDFSIVENNANHMVRVGGFQWGKYGTGAFSVDNGQNWTEFEGWPNSKPNGKVAVSASSIDKIVAIPLGSKPIYTADRGVSWQESAIGENKIITQIWQMDQNLEADKVNGNIFYIYNRENGKFYRSEDAGASFDHVSTLPAHGWGEWVFVRTVPNVEEAVWVGSHDEGLKKSSDGGDTFTSIPQVDMVDAFSFGANAPGSSNPSLYLVGQVNGQKGVFLSNDMGNTFTMINRGSQKIGDGLGVTDIAASRQEYGKVYFSTGGWGLFYGMADGLGPVNYALNTIAVNGSVTPSGGGFSSTSTPTLTATPNTGYIFTGWSGDLSGNKTPITIFMNGDKNITANFKVPELIASIATNKNKGGAPLTVQFDATNSVEEDPTKSITSYAWNFGDGTSASGSTVTHTYNALGAYTAILTITNNQNETDVASVDILVDAVPTIQITNPANNSAFEIGSSVTLQTAINDGGEDDIDRVIFFDKNWAWINTDRNGPDYAYTFIVKEGANEYRAQVYDNKGNSSSSSLITLYGDSTLSTYQTPYSGTAVALPGLVQAEEYDNGGEGVAFNDSDAGSYNCGGRSDDVDLEQSSNDDGTCNVGWITAGEWLEYTVNIAQSGNYTIETRVASGSGGGTYEISFSDGGSTGDVNFAGTGGWQNWNTVTTTGVALNAGQQIMRIDMKSANFNINSINVAAESANNYTITASSGSNGAITPSGNITVIGGNDQSFSILPNNGYQVADVTVNGNSVGIVTNYTFSNVATNHTISASFSQVTNSQSPFSGSPLAVPGLIQAEAYDNGGQGVAYNDVNAGYHNCGGRTDNVDLQQSSNDDGTCNVGYIANGEWLEYTVNVAQSGMYTIEARVAASYGGGTYSISFSNGGTTGDISFNYTGGWQNWTTASTEGVFLNAGQQVMRIDMKSSNFNLNYINIVSETSTTESFINHSSL